ncbi:ent-kaurene synthase [Colletotrichum falcatum]|nr:ent-kaurene synthase [Colletotrichum falcatum]
MMSSVALSRIMNINQEAACLTRQLLDDSSPNQGAGLITPSIYDTAWLALVKKRNADGRQQWLFPECFQYVVDTQLADGGWETHRSHVDGILNTAASLLVLRRHASEPLQVASVPPAEIQDRMDRASAALQSKLHAWDVTEPTHYNCEMILPTLLDLLKKEGVSFEFQGEATLQKAHEAKMSAFGPECLYGKERVAALHFLEAFTGRVDYGKVSHHKVDGGFMRSPSSTAAYLIGLSDSAWDDDAEGYLANVLARTGGKSVPCAFPSADWESATVLSALLQAGFSATQLGSSATEIAQLLNGAVGVGNDTMGLGIKRLTNSGRAVPSVVADTKDAANIISELRKLGDLKSPVVMLHDVELNGHVRTDTEEQDNSGSIGANSNVLLALLHQPNPAEYLDHIADMLRWLCNTWWKGNWPVWDKRNLSPLYPSMLAVQALVYLLERVEDGTLPESLVSDTEIRTKIAVAIFHAAIRTVEGQGSAGSWNESVEETAYAVILLSAAARVTLFGPVRPRLVEAIRRAEGWLDPRASLAGDHLWIGKVAYGSLVLTRAYRLAALRSASLLPAESTIGHCLRTAGAARKSEAYIKVYRATPLFSKMPEHLLLTAVVESSLFLTMLKEHTYDLFTRENVGKDKYFTLIPFTWTGCCMLMGLQPSAEFLWELMKIGVLGFQTDEFTEGVIQPGFAGNHDVVRQYVRSLIPTEPGDSSIDPDGLPGVERLKPLELYRDFIMEHWAVTAASPADRLNLAREVRAYLLAQIQQAEDNVRFARDAVFAPTTSYFSWARSIGTDHIASPLYFAFLSCLIPQTVCRSLAGRDILPTAEEKYYAEAVSKHSGCMCRIYNDLGSISRDAAEGNINSLDYPEFGHTVAKEKKAALWDIAQFERAAWEHALERLEEATERRMASMGAKEKRDTEARMKYWRMYCHITDLYGQIWVIRDYSSDVMKPAR